MIYLDNAATTVVCPAAAERMVQTLTEVFANPSSLYAPGLAAHKALEAARRTVAGALGCGTDEVIFTAGGTEANNLAVLGAARARRAWGREVVVSGTEHPSVQNTMDALGAEGFTIIAVPPLPDGRPDLAGIAGRVNRATALVACMSVNNETGALADVAALAAQVKEINKRTAFHCDHIQGFLKHPLPLGGVIDTVSVSGHKVHAPKGIGALYVRRGFHLEKVIFGGGQERGLRSGTENVAGAAAFAAAIGHFGPMQDHHAHVSGLNARLRAGVAALPGAVIHSPGGASPYILSFSLPGFRSETILHFLEERGIYVSSGSACGRGARSHTLAAMGLPEALLDSAVRVSFCPGNTAQEVDALCRALGEARLVIRH